jgi:hypothetical protein
MIHPTNVAYGFLLVVVWGELGISYGCLRKGVSADIFLRTSRGTLSPKTYLHKCAVWMAICVVSRLLISKGLIDQVSEQYRRIAKAVTL